MHDALETLVIILIASLYICISALVKGKLVGTLFSASKGAYFLFTNDMAS